MISLIEVRVVESKRGSKVQDRKLVPVFNKRNRQRLSDYLKQMNSSEIEQILAPFRNAVKEYGDIISDLKAKGAAKIDIDRAVVELKARKKKLADRELDLAPKDVSFDRLKLEDLLKRRFFYDQSFAIYGGVTGLYDYGPMGCAMKANILNLWRKHFILEESMLEVDCSVLTPEPVLKASGHVDRFADWMVKDVANGECFRADHLIKNHAEKILKDPKADAQIKEDLTEVLAKLEGFDNNDMQRIITKYNLKSPNTGNDLTEPIAFNLMFSTLIGPTGDVKAYLRPETAQGIFVNFKRLLEFNQGKLPFAAAQIGSGFRNEISPRQGLIRVREFTMCEIEHFVDPNDKSHSKFWKVANTTLSLYSAFDQMNGRPTVKCTIGEAVEKGIVANETLGYYMARVHLFLIKIGIDPTRLRFRQHLSNEMAHYACDCWDAEILTSYGWIECVGNADRSCYDLQQHFKATNVKLCAEKKLNQPMTKEVTEFVPNKSAIGMRYKSDVKKILAKLDQLSLNEIEKYEKAAQTTNPCKLSYDGGAIDLTSDMFSVKRFDKKVHVEDIIPSVIEPSFGVGRILYAILEHSFCQREGDEQRRFLALPPIIAPIKCSLLPISANERFEAILEAVSEQLRKYEISFKLDDSGGSIGRRYARTDEIGIPYGVTVDFQSEEDPWTVTLRYALTMEQVRLTVSEVGIVVSELASGRLIWNDVLDRYPRFEQNVN